MGLHGARWKEVRPDGIWNHCRNTVIHLVDEQGKIIKPIVRKVGADSVVDGVNINNVGDQQIFKEDGAIGILLVVIILNDGDVVLHHCGHQVVREHGGLVRVIHRGNGGGGGRDGVSVVQLV